MEGWHGTSSDNAKEILSKGFGINKNNPPSYLGYGVYFFIKGLKCPLESAELWAIAESYNKESGKRTYNNYCILKSDIIDDENAQVLDLRTDEGAFIAYKFVEEHIERMKLNNIRAKIRYKPDVDKVEYIDGYVCEEIKKVRKIDIIISRTFIRFEYERKNRIRGNLLPNVVMASVSNIGIIKGTIIAKRGII